MGAKLLDISATTWELQSTRMRMTRRSTFSSTRMTFACSRKTSVNTANQPNRSCPWDVCIRGCEACSHLRREERGIPGYRCTGWTLATDSSSNPAARRPGQHCSYVRASQGNIHLLLHGARSGGQIAAEGEPAEGDPGQEQGTDSVRLERRAVHPVQGAVHRLEAVHGRLQESSKEEGRAEGGVGHIQGCRNVRGGSQGREQDSCYTEDCGREDLVHTRGLGTWRSQDQERVQGRGRDGHGRTNLEEGQEGGGQVTCTNCSLLYSTVLPIIVTWDCVCVSILSFYVFEAYPKIHIV